MYNYYTLAIMTAAHIEDSGHKKVVGMDRWPSADYNTTGES